MVSILIPVYNWDITELVKTLHHQAEQAPDTYEILCFDDQSATNYQQINRQLQAWPLVTYKEMNQNLGCCALRNRLAREAQYNNLLFIDSDMKIASENFLQNYKPYYNTQQVVYGGIIYPSHAPHHSQLLRWYYGKQREERKAEVRNQSPHLSFMSQNFLIPRELFDTVEFDERLPYPGHDDTLFGYILRENGVPVTHIDNPLLHMGIPGTNDFLDKTDRALHNLWRILSFKDIDTIDFQQYVKVLYAYRLIKKKHSLPIIKFIFNTTAPLVRYQLHSNFPSLRLFDFYKLGRFSTLKSP